MTDMKFRGVAIADLIGMPVVAIVNANDMMAKQQVSLLMQNCFSETGDVYEPVMITMSLYRGFVEPSNDNDSISIRRKASNFQIPLITLLPLNSLAIEEAKIEFDMEVYYHHDLAEDEDSDLLAPNSLSTIESSKSYELTGSIKYQSGDWPKGSGNHGEGASAISISISTSKLPLPLGVSTILNAYSHGVHASDTTKGQEK